MIDALISWSLRNRAAVLVMAALLLVIGGYTALKMPVDVFPDLTAPTVTVITKRGTEAMEDFAIIPGCQGWLIHDHWAPYFAYQDSPHALCNEHLLRELKFLAEEHQEAWAEGLS